MIGDTIFAVSSPPGAAARGVLRVSGPDAHRVAAAMCAPAPPAARCVHECQVDVDGRPVDALVLVMPGPGSFTGEDVVELHLPGSPLLLEVLSRRLLAAARPALAGEFTRRAYQNGRLDLAGAEAVLALIHAGSDAERRFALAALRGGFSDAVDGCRAAVQDALATIEAGLDFTAGETGEVEPGEFRTQLVAALGRLDALAENLPPPPRGGDVVLLGPTNAGKSSLVNALAGREAVLVADRSGTTRDVVRVEVGPGLWLCDAPGDLDTDPTGADGAAIALRDRIAGRCAAAIVVADPDHDDRVAAIVGALALPLVAVVRTKVDLAPLGAPSGVPEGVPWFGVSSTTGAGIAELRAFLADRCSGPAAPRGDVGAGARVRGLLGAARDALAAAIAATDDATAPELVAVDAQDALARLDAVHGRSSPEDLLDRIFARFCLGK